MAAPDGSHGAEVSARRAPADPATIVLAVRGRIERAAIPELCERVRAVLEGCDAHHVVCEVDRVLDVDAVTVDALARLQITVKRSGREFTFRRGSRELDDLIELMGLRDVVPATET